MYGLDNYKFNGKVAGFLKLNWTGLTKGQLIAAFLLILVLNIGVLFLLAWGFQLFWAWFVPVFWPSAPMLGYWHSFASVVILLTLRDTFNQDKD